MSAWRSITDDDLGEKDIKALDGLLGLAQKSSVRLIHSVGRGKKNDVESIERGDIRSLHLVARLPLIWVGVIMRLDEDNEIVIRVARRY